MEEVYEKPSSTILFRQLSTDETGSLMVLDTADVSKNQAPKIVDMKMKNLIEEKYSGKKLAITPNTSDISPQVSKIEKSLFMMDLQKKLSSKPIPPKKPNRNSGNSNIEVKIPEIVTVSAQNFQTSKLECDEETSLYVEMRSPVYENSDNFKIIKETVKYNEENDGEKVIQSGDNIIDNFNSRLPPIYEDLSVKREKKDTPVALIKAMKMKSQSSSGDSSCPESESNYLNVNEDMATLRPKSPKPIIAKNEKEESFWDKIGTLGRKKRIKEVQEVQEEGKYAIDSPGFAVIPTISPEDYDLEENEERSVIMPKAFEDPKLRELIQVLIDWINDELASQRIIVQDLTEDLYDGQVFQKLFEMLTGNKLDVPEVTQSEEGQKQKLSVVLSHFNRVLGLPHNHNKWNVEVIHSKSIVPILHLLVALARHFRPPVRLPENVSVSVTVVQKTQGQLTHRVVREVITSEYSDVGMRCERDAFDTLFDHAPDKLQVVKKSMVTFVNKHLNKLNLEVTEIESQFHDGVYLIMLMGLLEGFFVPLYSFFPTPKDHDQKVHNVSFAFELMEEVGLARPKARPEDVVNLDLKSTLRVLYNLFNKYKTLL
ncbi:beta-parvin [Coccinella septempunctata]|uniref:beta-parvin n=1 Tax=Coccinella septempunctata TaxID=41139 RepID=UPI001D091654|nr:beta-parvin [Coccinella septempunctata]